MSSKTWSACVRPLPLMPVITTTSGTRLRLSATRMLWLSPMLVSPALVSLSEYTGEKGALFGKVRP